MVAIVIVHRSWRVYVLVESVDLERINYYELIKIFATSEAELPRVINPKDTRSQQQPLKRLLPPWGLINETFI